MKEAIHLELTQDEAEAVVSCLRGYFLKFAAPGTFAEDKDFSALGVVHRIEEKMKEKK